VTNEEVLAAFTAHMQKVAPGQTCPVCKRRDFRLRVAAAVELHEITTTVGHIDMGDATTARPVGVVTCRACGYLYFVDLLTARVVDAG